MNRPKRTAKRLIILAAILVLLLVVALPLLRAQGGLSLAWGNISSGYGISSGGGFRVAGTSGEIDGGSAASGDGFTMTGGFWSGAEEPPPFVAQPEVRFHIFLPSTMDR